METELEELKGVHPGLFLAWELKKRAIGKSRFALEIGEYPQTFSAITKGKRKMNIPLALRIEQKLNLREGFLMMLQLFHDIAEEKKRSQEKPDISKFSKSLFWDTNTDAIDWQKHKRWVIERVFQRGDEQDKAEIERFYGSEEIKSVLDGKSLL